MAIIYMERKKGRDSSDTHAKRVDKERIRTFESLVEALGDAFCLLEMNGTVLCVNPAFENLTGYRRSDLLGKNAFDLIHTMMNKENAQKVEETFSRALEGKITPQVESSIVTKNGREIVISATASFLKNEEGKSNGIVATFRDVTERSMSEESIKLAAKEWQTTFDSTNDLVMLLDSNYEIVRVNRAATEFFNLPVEKIIGTPCFTLMHMTEYPPSDCPLTRMKKTGRHEETDLYLENKNIWAHISVDPIFDAVGDLMRVVHIVRDVTERKRAEEEIRRRMNQLIILHQSSKEILQAGYDLDKVYVAIHHATSQLMPAEAFVISLLDEERKEIKAVYLIDRGGRWPSSVIPIGGGISGRVISTGKSMYIRDVAQISLNSVHFGHPESVRSILAVPLPLGEKVMGMIATESYSPEAYTQEDQVLLEMLAAHVAPILHNATLFEEAKRSNLQLEFVNDLMSHDLTNINQVTLGYLDFLKETELSEKQRRFVETILYSTRRNMRLIENVKKLWESSRVSPKPIDVDKCIRAAMEEINIFPGKKVRLNYTPKAYFALADEFLIDVVGNLIDNAIKFDSSEEVVIDISVIEEGDKCRVTVADRGKGIPDAYKSTIFSRLERLEKGVRGTGLGLHLVKTIVSLYGGEVWVENNNPAGSIFNIRLPTAKNR